MKLRSTMVALSTAGVLAAAGVLAQQPGSPPPGMGPGQGHGAGMMHGPGGSRMGGGMGPGMMGGGMAPGMMGDGMMGQGRGGAMGSGGMMPGQGRMMGSGGGMRALWQLDLSDAQRQQVLKLHDELRRKNWDLLGKQQDEQAKLRDAFLVSGSRDRAAIMAAYRRIADLRLQRIEHSLDTAEKVEALLTPQQRESLRRTGPWWLPDADE
jgi:Spy/CpxP family protein refolding chaperone